MAIIHLLSYLILDLTDMEVEAGSKVAKTFKTKLEIDPSLSPQQRSANASNKLGNKRTFVLKLQSKDRQQVPAPLLDDTSVESTILREKLRSMLVIVLNETLGVSFDISFPGWCVKLIFPVSLIKILFVLLLFSNIARRKRMISLI